MAAKPDAGRDDETAGWRPWWVPLTRTVVAGEELDRGDLVRLNDRGEIERAGPADDGVLCRIPADGVFRDGVVCIPLHAFGRSG